MTHSSQTIDTMKRAYETREDSAEEEEQEQTGGALGPLFEFTLTPVGRRRRWQHVVDHVQYRATLAQLREAVERDDLGEALMEALYRAIRDQLTPEAEDHHVLHVAIHANGFQHAFRSVNMTVADFLARDQYVNELLQTLADKLNSNEEFHPDQGLQVDVVVVQVPRPGRGKTKNLNVCERGFDKDSHRKQSIITVKNNDNLCCARAIVTMRAWCHRNDPVRFDSETTPWRDWINCRAGRPRQTVLARELHQAAGVPEGPCGIPELRTFQAYLATLTPPYQLKVMARTYPFVMRYIGPEAPLIIRLLQTEDHFEGCTTFQGFRNRVYWCDECNRAFNVDDANHHRCDGRKCRACQRNTCPDFNKFRRPQLECARCYRCFYGEDCLQYHQSLAKCHTRHRCRKCCKDYKVDKKRPHRCGYADCPSCGQYLAMETHRCFIQPPPPPPPQRPDSTPPPKLVYADIETMTDADRGFHPTLLCYRGEWQDTITTLRHRDCDDNTDVVDVFIQHLDDYAHPADGEVEEQPLVVLFHNLKGFDGVFILNSLYKAARRVEDQLTVGSKVLSFVSGALTFKDSLCFLPMPLANFPATFGLTELKKGFFPHLFNTPDHQEYVGPLPDLSYFDPDGMSPSKKADLEQWHAAQLVEMGRTGAQYHFQAELEAYCQSDVDILQGGCEAFTQEFQRKAGFNPFVECYTIASACNRYWRQHHLPEQKIAVEPPQGWRGARINQSWAALQWLHTEQTKLPPGQIIRHVRNGGEQAVRTTKGREFVDGLNPASVPPTVYEFLGCLWHGCNVCFTHQRHRNYGAQADRSLAELFDATLAKNQRLRDAGFQVTYLWEHQWQHRVKTTPALQAQLAEMTSTPPLQPRDAFFGGRTGAVALYHQVDPGEKIFYIDVTSLYPWVNKTQKYPLGHPEIFYEPEDQDLSHYFGLALVSILPPRGLFHPVLPVREGGKLTFPLCGACVREEQAKPLFERSAHCPHSDLSRQLQGTWCTPELEEAVRRGYQLLPIHEVWHFRETQVGLFADYVNTWLKIKQESAGWPSWCQTDEQKQAYKRDYLSKEGIQLEHVAKNPGRKQVAKLMLNSFWGKFGERTNKSKVEQILQPADLLNLVTDAATELQALRICNEDVLEVRYKQTEANDMPSTKTNIFVAAFTTCWARLKLYSYLHLLQRQVLYYDTDSVIYSWKEGQPQIATGDFLGEMTDELDGDSIQEFVSGGAKNYGYHTVGGKFCCKVRGFTLNVRGRARLNYQSMKEHIMDTLTQEEQADPIPVENPHHFVRDTTNKKIKLDRQTKQYRLVFDKRVVDGTHSLPFGYH